MIKRKYNVINQDIIFNYLPRHKNILKSNH